MKVLVDNYFNMLYAVSTILNVEIHDEDADKRNSLIISRDKAVIACLATSWRILPRYFINALVKFDSEIINFIKKDRLVFEETINFFRRMHCHVYKQLKFGNMSNLSNDFHYKYSIRSTTDWSHPMWYIIHTLALRKVDTNDIYLHYRNYKQFIGTLRYIIPCQECCEHLRDNLINHNMDKYVALESDTSTKYMSISKESNYGIDVDNYYNNLYAWSFDLHRLVSQQIYSNDSTRTYDKSLTMENSKNLYK